MCFATRTQAGDIRFIPFDTYTLDAWVRGYAPIPLGIRFDTRTQAGDIRFIPFDTYTLDVWVRGYAPIPLRIR